MRCSFASLEAFIIDEQPDSDQGYSGGADGNRAEATAPAWRRARLSRDLGNQGPGAIQLDFTHSAIILSSRKENPFYPKRKG
jgi:hypothetical protein